MSHDENSWRCPLCEAALTSGDSGFECENTHRYDIAKQGYVNLLLANQKGSAEPGDSSEMVQARRDFLSAGHFKFLQEQLEQCFQTYTKDGERRLLDLGCGEGSYLKALTTAFPDLTVHAIDISKVAIKRAATFANTVKFAVASNFALPVQSQSQDLALAIFAPVKFAEIQRVLRDQGVFIRVSPGAKHLFEIKRELYDDVTLHSEPEDHREHLIESFSVANSATLNQKALHALMNMTPLHWKGKIDAKNRLYERAEMDVQFEFLIQVFRW